MGDTLYILAVMVGLAAITANSNDRVFTIDGVQGHAVVSNGPFVWKVN
jgi:hypothetical protein